MAARFWVGGTGTWDNSTTTHWSSSSGGSGGASVPGSSDTVTFDGNSGGGTVTLNYAPSVTSITGGAFTGTLDTANNNITCSGSFSFSGTGTRTLTLGSSAVSCGTWTMTTTTNLTFNANTSSITASGNFTGGGLTYYDVTLTSNATPAVSGANTFNNFTRTGGANVTSGVEFDANQTINGTLALNGNAANQRLLVASDTPGTARTLTAATVSCSYADFQDITGAGAGSWNLSAITGLSGDCGGNSGITFTSAQTQYWVGGTGSWNTAAEWGTSSGGSGGRVPLPQDDCVFDSASFSAGSQTVTANMSRLGKSINWTGVTNTPTWTTSTAATIYGSLTLVSGMTLTGSTQAYVFAGRSSYTITSAGKSWAKPISFTAPGGTYTLQDALTSSNTLTVNNGTFNANGNNVTATTFTSTGSTTRTVTMGSGTWTLTGTTTAWSTPTTTNLTFSATGNTLEFSGASQTLSTGGLTFGTVNFTAATPAVTISNANNFNAAACTITGSGALQMGTSGSWNVTTFTPNSSTVTWQGSGGAATITSNGQSFYNLTLNKTGGGSVSLVDALSVSNVFEITQNTFTTNDQNVTCANFSSSNSNTRTINMGFADWTLTGTGTVWDTATTTGLTLNEDTSTIIVSNTSASSKTFAGGGQTYYDWAATGGGSGAVILTGANTFGTITINAPKTVTFPAGVTTTVTGAFFATGSAGNIITINSSSAGSAATLSDPGGTNNCDYLSLQDSAATGGATWNATNSINVSGNSGWNITPPATGYVHSIGLVMG